MWHHVSRFAHRVGRWPRIIAAGLCLLLALGSALGAKRSASPGRAVRVVVAAGDLPAGHVLTARDLAVASWPARLRPGGTRASPRALVGERLAGPVRRGEPLTSGRLVGTDLTTGLPPGTVAVPVPLADDTVGQVVHPGDRIDLLAMPTAVGGIRSPGERSRATEVADHALVLAVLTAAAGEAATSDGVVDLVLALPRSTAARIAASESSERFAVVGDPP